MSYYIAPAKPLSVPASVVKKAAQENKEAVVTVAQRLQAEICPKCYGDGEYWDSDEATMDKCSICKGTGKRPAV